MRGLVLEGGGGRGAFHVGVMKAFKEHGYHFDGVVGTSIGAYNAAIWVQGDLEQLHELWLNMHPGNLFDVENEHMEHITNNRLSKESLVYLGKQAKIALKNKGIDTSKLRILLEETVDEKRIRESEVEFGLVTVGVPHFKPVKLYTHSIPEGKMADYIMASANYPGFKLEPIDQQYYIDGGVHENCPVSLLLDRGYEQIIAVRTTGRELKYISKKNKVQIINITPSEELGGILLFNNALIRKNIDMGYYEALRFIKGLRGRKYYIEPKEEEFYFDLLCQLSEEEVRKIGDALKIEGGSYRRILFEGILPKIAQHLKIPKEASYQYFILLVLEELAQKMNVERWQTYSVETFVQSIYEAWCKQEDTSLEYGAEKLGLAVLMKLIKSSKAEECI